MFLRRNVLRKGPVILTVDTVDSGAIIITRHVDGDFQGTKEIAQARKIAREVQLDTAKRGSQRVEIQLCEEKNTRN